MVSCCIRRSNRNASCTSLTYDPTVLTIEHVLPQTVDYESVWATQWPDFRDRNLWLHRLANLVPLTLRRNLAARNYDFGHMKKAYFGDKQGESSYALTAQVLNTATWTPAVVELRQADLLEVLSTKWELAEA